MSKVNSSQEHVTTENGCWLLERSDETSASQNNCNLYVIVMEPVNSSASIYLHTMPELIN